LLKNRALKEGAKNKNALELTSYKGGGFGTCDPAGIRTQDPYIKSVLLYQLSYGIRLLECLSIIAKH
jgi:hypothetical protein